MVKIISYIKILVLCLSAFGAFAQTGFGDPQLINEGWKFILEDNVAFKNINLDDTNWQDVNLPYDWSVEGQLSPSLASCTGYLPGGIAWYRKELWVPAQTDKKKVYLYFEGVYNRSEVYINGKLLDKRPNGYISFAYDATPFINFGEKNIISVRVDHSLNADSRWYTGSGIYRDVWLIYANPVHIDQWGVYAYPEVKGKKGELKVETTVKNESGADTSKKIVVVNELFSPSGKKVADSKNSMHIEAGASYKVSTNLKVNNPELWELEEPALYTLKTIVYEDGKVIDHNTVVTGFRTFTFDADKGFALNGKWMKMKGVCLHHDAGVLGAAVPKSVWKTRLQTLKSMGVNAIRTSHNPQAPYFYDICDEIGLMVLNEAYDEWKYPKRKWLEGWNVGTPGFEGSYDIFADWAEKDLADMVLRDRNHLSVFAWSIGNEVDYPNDPYSHPVLNGGKDTGFAQPAYGGYKPDAPDAMELGEIAQKLVKVVKQFDKSRPVTAGLAGVAMSNETAYPGALDIVGYNYTESKYRTDHEKYPERVIYGSENGQGLDAWKAVVNNDHIFGQFLWTGFDYLGESGRWPSRGFYTGLVDFAGNIKPRGYFRKALWSEEPSIYLGTYISNNNRLSMDAFPIWNYEEGEIIRVVCYTNAKYARLELNGEVVGDAKAYDVETGIIYWDVPFKPGRLEAVGLDDKKEVCRYTIHTSKRPYALKAATPVKMVTVGDIIQINVQVVDEDGIPVMLSDNEVACIVNGGAELLGLEAGNNSDMTDYTDNRQRVFHGKLTAYFKITEANQNIAITFSSPWLETDILELKSL